MRFAIPCAALIFVAAVPALAADAFDEARYDIGIKKNAEALAIVDSGAFDVNLQTGEGYSLLHYAADAGNLDMVKALLARGANPALRAANGHTALDMATAPLVQAELRRAMGATSAPARVLAPAATHATARSTSASPSAAAIGAAGARRKECNQKWHADQALAGDSTAKMTTYRKWQQCLKTGRYW